MGGRVLDNGHLHRGERLGRDGVINQRSRNGNHRLQVLEWCISTRLGRDIMHAVAAPTTPAESASAGRPAVQSLRSDLL